MKAKSWLVGLPDNGIWADFSSNTLLTGRFVSPDNDPRDSFWVFRIERQQIRLTEHNHVSPFSLLQLVDYSTLGVPLLFQSCHRTFIQLRKLNQRGGRYLPRIVESKLVSLLVCCLLHFDPIRIWPRWNKVLNATADLPGIRLVWRGTIIQVFAV